MLDLLLRHGSLALCFLALVAGGLGIPLPEDAVLLAAGAMSHRGVVPIYLAVPVCMAGVLTGDIVLFTMARRLGPAVFERRFIKRLVTPARRVRAEEFVARRGGVAVFVARHVAGLRAPVFATAAINGMPLGKFLLWDAMGLMISAPAVLGLGWWSSEHVELVHRGMARVEHWVLFGVAIAVLLYAVISRARAQRT
ncbi:MAG: DedA family protein [Polyangiaceae bacterium]|nr:DedA family protein [Polyangiaceae bacterium]